MNGQTHGGWLPCRSLLCFNHLLPARVITDGPERARLPSDIFEGIEEAIALRACAERFAVDEEFNFLCARHYIDVLLRVWRIVPVAYDVYARPLDINPAVPHHLIREISILRQSHGVH